MVSRSSTRSDLLPVGGRDKLWITRSQPGADRLAAVLQDAGYPCLVSPVLQIAPLAPPALPARLAVAVALSEHAVMHAPADLWARADRVIAVGARTAAVLAARGVQGDLPAVASSEGLLDGPLAPLLANAAAVSGPIALVCGAGGRTLLQEQLRAAGLAVLNIEVYRRQTVLETPAALGQVRALVVSSGDGFSAAGRLWCPGDLQPDVPVFAPSPRVVALAGALGFRCAYDCGGADAESVLSELRRVLPLDEKN